MRLFSVLSALILSSASAQASELLFSYSFGNQITASQLEVYADGSIHHGEWSQPRFQVVEESPLSSGEVARLKALVAEASIASITETPVMASFGSKSGTISITVNGMPRNLAGILRDTNDLSKAILITNSSSAIEELRSWINSIVLVDME